MREVSIQCRICRARSGRLVLEKPYGIGVSTQVVECAQCRTRFIQPFPKADQIRALYQSAYFHCDQPLLGGYEDYEADEPQIRQTFERRWRQIAPYFQSLPPQRGLDVGCATGVFLEVMQNHGVEARGVDISSFAVESARRKGLNVVQGDLSAISQESYFDLVTLWDSIEHVEDPLDLMRNVHRVLRPGGLSVLTTPDASAPLAQLLGSYWLGYRSVGEHLYFFSRAALRHILQQAGFEVLAIWSLGKYMKLDRILTRLSYYTRVFRWARKIPVIAGKSIYLSSGDTMCVVARRL
jgi:2-polyprenyl-3-methyl-5-hydroxy-6-metoxy-1,4-benzoquinol methylase